MSTPIAPPCRAGHVRGPWAPERADGRRFSRGRAGRPGGQPGQADAAQRRIALQALFERMDIDDEGHVGAGGLVPREWAKQAFGALVWAWRRCYHDP